MSKYTDTELSTILGEHDCGYLIGSGDWIYAFIQPQPYPRGCINQAAYNEPDETDAPSLNRSAAKWFDLDYRGDWSNDKFLSALEGQGLA